MLCWDSCEDSDALLSAFEDELERHDDSGRPTCCSSWDRNGVIYPCYDERTDTTCCEGVAVYEANHFDPSGIRLDPILAACTGLDMSLMWKTEDDSAYHVLVLKQDGEAIDPSHEISWA